MTDDAVALSHFARLAALDPLLPAGARLVGDDPVEAPGAVGYSFSDVSEPTTAIWGAARTHTLRLRLATGSDAELGGLLDEWEKRLAASCTPGDRDESAVVRLASRDSVALRELVFRGFATATVIAVRPAGRSSPPARPGNKIRPAEPSDIPALTELSVELHSHAAQYGMVTDRPYARELLETSVREAVEAGDGLTMVAEQDGEVIGLVEAMVGERAAWMKGMTSASPAAYIAKLFVRPDVRASGVGGALVTDVHAKLDERGVSATLLEHVLHNEFSTPFWYRHGYRPLWTTWQRRPAVR
ncbi:GNAT family N-acetyltransferase [Allokutzneria sp. NRRL B-24872]|uniref:GNAT family N-acetyltransferase n=1 Tax=Allokutzneria sp. NRRL B-24872 TaxID=1137961 RepID=UPI000A37293D|nr:GNAT family N-acetyltransferase [Allokutzneria sp. NRRL B-24872]